MRSAFYIYLAVVSGFVIVQKLLDWALSTIFSWIVDKINFVAYWLVPAQVKLIDPGKLDVFSSLGNYLWDMVVAIWGLVASIYGIVTSPFSGNLSDPLIALGSSAAAGLVAAFGIVIYTILSLPYIGILWAVLFVRNKLTKVSVN